jgi:hypothetical protein
MVPMVTWAGYNLWPLATSRKEWRAGKLPSANIAHACALHANPVVKNYEMAKKHDIAATFARNVMLLFASNPVSVCITLSKTIVMPLRMCTGNFFFFWQETKPHKSKITLKWKIVLYIYICFYSTCRFIYCADWEYMLWYLINLTFISILSAVVDVVGGWVRQSLAHASTSGYHSGMSAKITVMSAVSKLW